MAKTVKVGVIGAGQVAYMHLDGLRLSPNAEIVAVADVSRKRLKAAAKKYGIPHQFEDYRDLLAMDDLDAVTIGLPNYLHAQACLEALNANKHICCEKPFAMNAKEAAKVVALAKKLRRTFMIGQNFRFNPDVQVMKGCVERGELGDVYHAHAYWLRRSGIPRIGSWFTQKKYAGGGCMLDIGVHILDATLHMMGNFKPKAVSGTAYTKFGNRGIGDGTWGLGEIDKKAKFDVDDHAVGLIKLAGGRTVALEISWAAYTADASPRGVDLYGTEGGGHLFPATLYKKGKRDYETTVLDQDSLPLPTDRMVHFIDCIVKRKKPVCAPEQSLAVQKILDAIYESSKTGKEVRIK